MSTVLVSDDTIDLLVSALMLLGLSPDPAKPMPTGAQCVTHVADGIGRELSDANLDAVSLAEGTNPPRSTYRWQPIMEIGLSYVLQPTVALQVEASRRHYVRNCASHPGWNQSQARQIVARLGESLRRGPLQRWPRASHGDLQRLQECEPAWTRDSGFAGLQAKADA